MEVHNLTEVRKNFAAVIEKICNNHVPMIITRQKGEPAVLMSLKDYNSLQETLYLLGNKTNSKALFEALSELERGEIVEQELITQ